MWWGKEDDEMYYPGGRPANDAARRAVRERGYICTSEPCVALSKRADAQHERRLANRGGGKFRLAPSAYLPMQQAIDLTRSMFGSKVTHELAGAPPPHDAEAQPAEGACLVAAPSKGGRAAALSTGDPDEIFVGFKLGGMSEGCFSVVVGGGQFQIYTTFYDKNAEWFLSNKCLPIAGPEGKVTTGVFPDDLHRAIGRVVTFPTEKDPYLGISGLAYT